MPRTHEAHSAIWGPLCPLLPLFPIVASTGSRWLKAHTHDLRRFGLEPKWLCGMLAACFYIMKGEGCNVNVNLFLGIRARIQGWGTTTTKQGEMGPGGYGIKSKRVDTPSHNIFYMENVAMKRLSGDKHRLRRPEGPGRVYGAKTMPHLPPQ